MGQDGNLTGQYLCSRGDGTTRNSNLARRRSLLPATARRNGKFPSRRVFRGLVPVRPVPPRPVAVGKTGIPVVAGPGESRHGIRNSEKVLCAPDNQGVVCRKYLDSRV